MLRHLARRILYLGPQHNKMSSTAAQASALAVNPLKRDPSVASVNNKRAARPKRFKEPPKADPISNEGVLITDMKAVLKKELGVELEDVKNDLREFFSRPRGTVHEEHKEVVVKVLGLSGGGDGIAWDENSKKIVVVPYVLPGEVVKAKIYRTQKYFFEAELVSVESVSPMRDDSLVNCQYFGKCSGCQYQMIPYSDQLEIKRNVIVNAYKHNADLAPEHVPDILPTHASPLQFGYRTKLTPHFDVPKAGLQQAPKIGFGERGRKSVLDIEECAIATPVVNQGLALRRSQVRASFKDYKKGATILLRENLVTEQELQDIKENGEPGPKAKNPEVQVHDLTPDLKRNIHSKSVKMCSTSTKTIITERFPSLAPADSGTPSELVFQFPSSSFFQNNNSILPDVTKYVRDNLAIDGTQPRFLIDTYCGSGLFGVACSGAAEQVIGVEISEESVKFADWNYMLNQPNSTDSSTPSSDHKMSFKVGTASNIFSRLQTDPALTSMVIDPPRKGCDNSFLSQLIAYSPRKVVYVSCNVHSQARDVGVLVRDGGYRIVSVRGFDFFPMTHHVESVAVLEKVPS